MIFQLRGCSGSGKTWVVRQLFDTYRFREVKNRSGDIMGYYSKEVNLFVLGKYTTSCGGGDTIKTQDETCERIEKAVKKGYNVLFEGLIASHIAKRYADLYSRHNNSYFIFLDTPLEKCREQITSRRIANGMDPGKVAKNVEKDYTSTHRSRVNMNTMGVPKNNLKLYSSEKALRFIKKKLEES